VTLKVGQPEKIFSVHRGVLCRSSRLMQARLKPAGDAPTASPPDTQPQRLEVVLQDEKPEVVRTYINWLYTGQLPAGFKPQDTRFGGSRPKAGLALCELAGCYVFGEHLQDRGFQNAAIDAMGDSFRQDSGRSLYSVGSKVVSTIYERTPSSSPARRLLVDI
ncbi:hypothetical protein K431DRAFT_199362, partial [Polychaeton citri CBS 116435]